MFNFFLVDNNQMKFNVSHDRSVELILARGLT